ncbi:hypothetical protein IWZ01DRAFT_218184 [Phyllosticta capitalensis]
MKTIAKGSSRAPRAVRGPPSFPQSSSPQLHHPSSPAWQRFVSFSLPKSPEFFFSVSWQREDVYERAATCPITTAWMRTRNHLQLLCDVALPQHLSCSWSSDLRLSHSNDDDTQHHLHHFLLCCSPCYPFCIPQPLDYKQSQLSPPQYRLFPPRFEASRSKFRLIHLEQPCFGPVVPPARNPLHSQLLVLCFVFPLLDTSLLIDL